MFVKTLAQNAFAAAQSFTNNHILNHLPVTEQTETDPAVDYACKTTNEGILSGALVGEDAAIDAFFANLDHYNSNYKI